MAVASTALHPFLARFPPLSPLRSSFQRFFFSTSFLPLSSAPLHPKLPLLSCPFSAISPPPHQTADFSKTHDFEEEKEDREEPRPVEQQETEPVNALLPSFPTPELTIKEKKELASYAHSLGKKLKSQQVGKSGVTPTVAAAMVEALESNELLKLKIHGSCPGELSDVIKQLENATGSAAVSQIGRTVILYRPSLSKMKRKDVERSRKQQQTEPIKSVATLKYQKKARTTRNFTRAH